MELHDYFTSINALGDYPVGAPRCVYAFSRLPQLEETFAPFALSGAAGDGDTFSRARRVMQWVTEHTAYDGASPLGPALPAKIIRFGIEQKKPINCANRAILFCDALVSLGIFALPVNLEHRPYLPEQNRLGDECHSHVIAQVWLPERKCWAAFDPSFNTYFTDRAGNCVGVPAMLTMQRLDTPACSVDNVTGQSTQNGALCTQIGLLAISVFPGNAFAYRYHWDELLYLVPQAYLDVVRQAKDEAGWAVWHNRLLTCPKLTLHDLAGEPCWID